MHELTNTNSQTLHSLKQTIQIQLFEMLKDARFSDHISNSIQQPLEGMIINHLNNFWHKFDHELAGRINRTVPSLISDMFRSDNFAKVLHDSVSNSINQTISHAFKTHLQPVFSNIQKIFNDGSLHYLNQVEDKLDKYSKSSQEKQLMTSESILLSMQKAEQSQQNLINSFSHKNLEDTFYNSLRQPMLDLEKSLSQSLTGHKIFEQIDKFENQSLAYKEQLNYLNDQVLCNRKDAESMMKRVEKSVAASLNKISNAQVTSSQLSNNSAVKISNDIQDIFDLKFNTLNEKFNSLNRLQNERHNDLQSQITNNLQDFTSNIENICRTAIIQSQKVTQNSLKLQQEFYENQMETQSAISSKMSHVTSTATANLTPEQHEKRLKSKVKKLLVDKKLNTAFAQILAETGNNNLNNAGKCKILYWLLSVVKIEDCFGKIPSSSKRSKNLMNGDHNQQLTPEKLQDPVILSLLHNLTSLGDLDFTEIRFKWLREVLTNLNMKDDDVLFKLKKYKLIDSLNNTLDEYVDSEFYDSSFDGEIKLIKLICSGIDSGLSRFGMEISKNSPSHLG